MGSKDERSLNIKAFLHLFLSNSPIPHHLRTLPPTSAGPLHARSGKPSHLGSQTPPGSETLGPQDLREPSPASQARWTADPSPAPVCCPGPDALSCSSRLSLAFQRAGCLAGGRPEEGRQHTHPSPPRPTPGSPGASALRVPPPRPLCPQPLALSQTPAL